MADYNREHCTELVLRRNLLSIPSSICHDQFCSLFQKISSHLEHLLSLPALSGLRYIFLVGGFAESELLQAFIRNKFHERVRVVAPPRPGQSVILGAVRFGLSPNIIACRIARCTIGVKVCELWNVITHFGGKQAIYDGRLYCNNLFDSFIRRDQPIDQHSEVTRTYHPITADQEEIELVIHSCEKAHPRWTTSPDVTLIGSLRVKLPHGTDRSVEVVMNFGGPTFKVKAFLHGRSKQVHAEFDFPHLNPPDQQHKALVYHGA